MCSGRDTSTNLAKICLQSAYPDSSLTREHIKQLDAASELERLKILVEGIYFYLLAKKEALLPTSAAHPKP